MMKRVVPPEGAEGLVEMTEFQRGETEHSLNGRASADDHSLITRFIPTAIDNVEASAEPDWLIHEILPARGLACIVGPPKSRKSFFAADMLFAVTRGADYSGRATKVGPVFYLTPEGVTGFKRRLIAMRRHYKVEGCGVPFFMIEDVPDLGSSDTDLQQLLTDLDRFIADKGLSPPRAIVLDTLARCMGDGDENTAKDMGRFINRCGAIERHFGCLVVLVHHMGKDASKGGRGSNALNGGADVFMTVEKSGAFSKVRIVEMKDGPEGQEWHFRLLPYDLSATPKVGGATTAFVVEILSEPSQTQPRATKSTKPPAGVAGDLLKIIRRAIEDVGETNVGSLAVSNNVRAVSKANLRNCCNAMSWQSDREPNAFRAMLSKTLSDLRAKDLIGFNKEWIWLT